MHILSRHSIKATINGKTVVAKGGSISISNNRVMIDGVDVTDAENITIEHGQPNHISIEGNVESVSVTSGSVQCHDAGNVNTVSGDVQCGDVAGDVKTVSGDVRAKSIAGNVKTVSGDVKQ